MPATAVAHPNIALVKYWGKRDEAHNLPAVGSISITLDTLTTTTTVRFDPDAPDDHFTLDGSSDSDRTARVRRCLALFRERFPEMPHALVDSTNNFPTAAGLASSASGFAALVVAIDGALGGGLGRDALAELARRCSGSAARSLYGGFVELELGDPSQPLATPTRTILDAASWPLEVVIAITSAAAKPVGSTAGMASSARTSPYFAAWIDSSPADLEAARRAIIGRDFARLAEVSEHSCLKMHAVMLASRPALVYWNSATVDCLHLVRELRGRGVPLFFTIDAGPQVKAVCAPGAAAAVAAELAAVPGVQSTMIVGLGAGARVIAA